MSYKSLALAMGVLLPSNSPGVNSIWLPAIALKTPLVIKPGRYDPWTPLRLIEAFIKAGLPRKVIGYYPAGHEAGTNILEGCDRSLLFGSGPTVAPWVGRSEVQIHGPGCSKILIGPDVIQDWIEYKDVLLNSIYENGGRSCINASTIVVPERSHDVADELARELAHLEPRPAADPEACLAAFPQREVAEAIDRQIERSIEAFGALDVTRRYRRSPGRLVEAGGLTYLLPTLLLCSHPDDPLANVEFPFPFVAVVEAGREAMMSRLEPALVVTALTDDPQWMQELWSSRKIERLNQGPLATTHIDWSQPHEGNLFEFLYQRRAVQITGTSNAG